MSYRRLAEIVVRCIEYFELADEDQPGEALQHLEAISADLAEATPEEQAAVRQAAKDRLAWFLQEPDEYGYTPRKTLRPEHRQLLENIASGEIWGESSPSEQA